MTARDFARIALSFDGAEEGSQRARRLPSGTNEIGSHVGTKATRRAQCAFVGAVVTLLSCSGVFGQQANQPSARTSPASTQKDSTPLPDAPASCGVSSPGQPAGSAQPGTLPPSSSSSSSSTAPVQPRYWSSADPNAHVTVLENTLLRVITDTPIRTKEIHEGEALSFTLYQEVLVDDLLVIPRGATLHGVVVQSKKAGKLAGSPDLILKLVSLDLGGRNYPIYTYQFKVTGTSKTKPTETKVKGGAVIGAIAGAAFDGSANGPTTAAGKLAGMGTGAAVGAGLGTVVAAASPGPVIDIPAESQIDFNLASPISVVPVNRREADRLSEGLHSGGPVLYVRGETP
jgi:hypothetical protein